MALPPISLRKELAEGVASLLNQQNWSIPCQAARDWRAATEIEDTERAKITVTPGPKQKRILSRAGMYQHDFTIAVLIEQQTDGGDDQTAQEDEIDVLAQEVEDFLCNPANTISIAESTATRTARPTGAQIETGEDREQNDAVFSVAVLVNYVVMR